jgi:CheY-like chemotaxis protein
MKVLFLDDDLNRHKQFKQHFGDESNSITYVETAEDAINALRSTQFDSIFLDHDLGGKYYVESTEDTGWGVAKWIAENLEYKPIIILHSLNPVGAVRMYNVLKDAKFNPILSPFTCVIGQY